MHLLPRCAGSAAIRAARKPSNLLSGGCGWCPGSERKKGAQRGCRRASSAPHGPFPRSVPKWAGPHALEQPCWGGTAVRYLRPPRGGSHGPHFSTPLPAGPHPIPRFGSPHFLVLLCVSGAGLRLEAQWELREGLIWVPKDNHSFWETPPHPTGHH